MIIEPNIKFWPWGIMLIGIAMLASACNFADAQDHNLAQERECGNQAARAFNEQWKDFAKGYDRWESRHDSKLNRCLLKVLVPEDPWTVIVVDADTRHVLARYSGNWAPKLSAFNLETGRYRTPICTKRDHGDGAECETYAAFEKLLAEQFGFAPDGVIK